MAPTGPPAPRLIGSHCRGLVTQGISTYLKRSLPAIAHPFARVATAGRYPGSPQDRPHGREAFPVPGGVACIAPPSGRLGGVFSR